MGLKVIQKLTSVTMAVLLMTNSLALDAGQNASYAAAKATATPKKTQSATVPKAPAPIAIVINGKTQKFKLPVVEQNKQIYIPWLETMAQYGYGGGQNTTFGYYMCQSKSNTYFIKTDQRQLKLNQSNMTLSEAPIKLNGTAYTSLKLFTEITGIAVSYNAAKRQLVLGLEPQRVTPSLATSATWESIEALFKARTMEIFDDNNISNVLEPYSKYSKEAMLKRKYFYGNWQDAFISMIYYDFNSETNPDKSIEPKTMDSWEFQLFKMIAMATKHSELNAVRIFEEEKARLKTNRIPVDILLEAAGYKMFVWEYMVGKKVSDYPYLMVKDKADQSKIFYLALIYGKDPLVMAQDINRLAYGQIYTFEKYVYTNKIDYPKKQIPEYNPEAVSKFNTSEHKIFDLLNVSESLFDRLMTEGGYSFEDTCRYLWLGLGTVSDIEQFNKIKADYQADDLSIMKYKSITMDWSDVIKLLETKKQ